MALRFWNEKGEIAFNVDYSKIAGSGGKHAIVERALSVGGFGQVQDFELLISQAISVELISYDINFLLIENSHDIESTVDQLFF